MLSGMGNKNYSRKKNVPSDVLEMNVMSGNTESPFTSCPVCISVGKHAKRYAAARRNLASFREQTSGPRPHYLRLNVSHADAIQRTSTAALALRCLTFDMANTRSKYVLMRQTC